MRRVSAGWIQGRERLHAAFIDTFGVPDIFWLGHFGTALDRWTDEKVRDAWAAHRPRSDAQHNLYVHVPFCKSICTFCNYDRLRPSSPDQLEKWRHRVMHSIETIAPGARHLTWHTIYVGGGTPSVLPARMVREVMGALNQSFRFHPRATRYFEMDPAVMGDPRVAAWRDQGFLHTSFGIQTLNEDINESHNRGRQGRALVAKRFDELRRHGMERISCDFLLGLAETEPDVIAAEIEEVLREYHPENIDIYQLTPTQAYLEHHFDGDAAAFWAHAKRFVPLVRETMPRLAKTYGYDIIGDESGHRTSLISNDREPEPTTRLGKAAKRASLWVPDRLWNRFAKVPRTGGPPEAAPYSYQQTVPEQRGPLSTLGIGPSARSRIFGGGRLEYRDPHDDPTADGHAWWAHTAGDMASEATAYALLTLRDADRLDRHAFQHVFQADLMTWFPKGIAALVQTDRARLTDDALELLAHDRRDRARDLMWLLPTERLEHKLAERRGLSLSRPGLLDHLGPIQPGDTLVGSLRLDDVSASRLRLSHGATPIVLRVAPSLEAGRPTRLVVETDLSTHPDLRTDLKRAIAVLRKQLTPKAGPRSGDLRTSSRPTSL